VWQPEPLQVAPLVVGAIAYARRAGHLARRGRPVPLRRQAWFATGLALLAVALATPIDRIGEQDLFWVHMVQHLLIADLAAYCVVRGLTGALLRPLLALPLVGRLRVLAHPLLALPLWALILCGWHLPALYQAALAHSGLHALEHTLFFVGGAVMWAAVLSPLPGPAWFTGGAKVAYVLAVRTIGAALAMVFVWSGHPLYDWYGTPLSDQVTGGLIMFSEGSVVTLLVIAWLFLDWMREAPKPSRPEPRLRPDAGLPPPLRSSGARGRSA
jgi:putative membrane protein